MRRRVLLASICGLAAITTVSPASAQCPSGDGTLPGSSDSVTTLGTGDATPYTTFYVDDRDWADIDDDGTAGGLWIYIESNGVAGLQRGGGHPAFDVADPYIPYVGPPHIPGAPYFPPSPPLIGGWKLSEWLGLSDDCRTGEDGEPWTGPGDRLLF